MKKISEKQGLTDSGIVKGVQKAQKMYKELKLAVPGIGMLLELVTTIVDAMGILAPFQAIFDVILGLFGVMGAQILPVLMEAITPFIGVLMEMQPLFIAIGQIIAALIRVVLIPFIPLLLQLFEVWKPFLPLLMVLIPLIEAASPIIQLMADVMIMFSTFNVSLLLAKAIVGGVTAATKFLTDALKTLKSWINKVAATANALTGGGGGKPKKKEKKWYEWQGGTMFVPRTEPAIVHRGEKITPAGLVGVQEELLEELITETRMAREDANFRSAFKNRRRR